MIDDLWKKVTIYVLPRFLNPTWSSGNVFPFIRYFKCSSSISERGRPEANRHTTQSWFGVSPEDSLCTSDVKDGKVLFGNLYDGRNLYPLHHHDVVQAMSFSPSQYWLYIALDTFFVIWDLVVFNL